MLVTASLPEGNIYIYNMNAGRVVDEPRPATPRMSQDVLAGWNHPKICSFQIGEFNI